MILSYNNMIFVAVDMKLVLQMFSSERNVSHLMSTRLEIRCHWIKNYKLDFSSKIADLLNHCSSLKFSMPFIPGKASKAFEASILDDWKEDEVDWLKEVLWLEEEEDICCMEEICWLDDEKADAWTSDCPANWTPPPVCWLNELDCWLTDFSALLATAHSPASGGV